MKSGELVLGMKHLIFVGDAAVAVHHQIAMQKPACSLAV